MSQRKSGRMMSTPYIVGSGNIRPASTMTMRPSCSSARQLRPISPRPPRKVTRIVSLATSVPKIGDDGGGGGVEDVVARSMRQAAVTNRDADETQGGL